MANHSFSCFCTGVSICMDPLTLCKIILHSPILVFSLYVWPDARIFSQSAVSTFSWGMKV